VKDWFGVLLAASKQDQRVVIHGGGHTYIKHLQVQSGNFLSKKNASTCFDLGLFKPCYYAIFSCLVIVGCLLRS